MTKRITPIVWIEMPATVAVTASQRTRPMAMRPIGGPMSTMWGSFGVQGVLRTRCRSAFLGREQVKPMLDGRPMGYALAAVTSPRKQHAGMAALTLGALGVVFGDIGTSPLYALQAVFSADNHAVKTTQGDIYGVISLVFWSITIIVSIKYVTLI